MTRRLPQYRSAILRILSKTVRVSKRPGDSEEYYRRRLIYSALALPDEEWAALPKTVQLWVSRSGDALNNGKPMPKLPDDDSTIKSKRLKAQHDGAKIRHRNIKLRRKAACWRAMEIMADYGIDLQVPEVEEILLSEGYTLSKATLQVTVGEMRRAIRVLAKRELLARPIPGLDNDLRKLRSSKSSREQRDRIRRIIQDGKASQKEKAGAGVRQSDRSRVAGADRH